MRLKALRFQLRLLITVDLKKKNLSFSHGANFKQNQNLTVEVQNHCIS